MITLAPRPNFSSDYESDDWAPAWWGSDEQNMAEAQAFQAFVRSPGGGS